MSLPSPRVVCGLLLSSALLVGGCYVDTPASPDEAVKILSGLSADPDPSVRRTAVEALGKIGDPRVQSVLVNALHDAVPAVREAAAWSLGRLAFDGEAAHELITLLEDPYPSVQAAAAQALEAADEMPQVMSAVTGLLIHPEPPVRRAAVHVLMLLDRLDEAAAESLRRGTHDSDPVVRQWAVAALGESGARGVARALLDRFQYDPSDDVRAEAAYRLRFVADGALVKKLAAMTPSDRNSGPVTRWAQESVRALTTPSDSD